MKAWLLLFLIGFVPTTWAGVPETTIRKHADGRWQVTYRSAQPVERLAFQRNPDASRIERWSPVSPQFHMILEDGIETVRRKDGGTFTEAAFSLTPTFSVPPKDYAPFSPFSDGGMLFHSGRFFACIGPCGEQNRWPMKLEVPEGDIAIVVGRVGSGMQSWVDSDSGSKVYVGPAQPLEGAQYLSVIDPGLPAKLQVQLDEHLPGLMTYFASRLPELQAKPMLFASWSDTDDGRYGNKGGVLPNQIFMHWYGSESLRQLSELNTLFFFAHEAAHLYQGQGMNVEIPADFWVHEGGAEFMAAYALLKTHPAGEMIMNAKLDQARQYCLDGLQQHTGFESALAADFQLHYSCGMLIHNAINTSAQLRDPAVDQLDIWRAFDAAVRAGEAATARNYLAVARPRVEADSLARIEQILFDPQADAVGLIETL